MNVGELKKWIKDNGVPDDTPVVLHTEADEYHQISYAQVADGEAIYGFSDAWRPPDEDEPSGKPTRKLLVVDEVF